MSRYRCDLGSQRLAYFQAWIALGLAVMPWLDPARHPLAVIPGALLFAYSVWRYALQMSEIRVDAAGITQNCWLWSRHISFAALASATVSRCHEDLVVRGTRTTLRVSMNMQEFRLIHQALEVAIWARQIEVPVDAVETAEREAFWIPARFVPTAATLGVCLFVMAG
mgnify:CR=1 FL=1